jgi:hypothetical protein
MPHPADPRLKFGEFCKDSLKLYTAHAEVLLKIALVLGVVSAGIYIGGAALSIGFAPAGTEIDPTTFSFALTRSQQVVGVATTALLAILICFGMAASIHAAAGADTVRTAFSRVTAQSIQIFWLQLVIYALAIRFSPYAALLLWVLVAFAVPVAILENLGPSAATDRAAELSRGHRLMLAVIELVVLLPLLATIALMVLALLVPETGINLNVLPVAGRVGISWLVLALIAVPVQFVFVALTQAYLKLSQAATEPVLHAKAATSVNP